ncbi:LUD domain-containing protein [Actinocatenispora sera]|uniref:LutC/YkgG family protein n=1 Tax=Actinocatenispora sera TaxID=390989 RepID=UPI003404C11F
MSEARAEIMARLRTALRDVPADEAIEDAPVARDYRRDGTGADPARLRDLLADRVADYRATVHRCGADELATTVRTILAGHETATLLVPHDLPDDWHAGYAGTIYRDSANFPYPLATLDATDTVLTGCAVAIAETGTLVLDAGMAQGRRAITLVPDHHVCVVGADQVVGTVPEALARLDPVRPLTFVAGPSATSDIEFDRVEGVHGPRHLDVILLHGAPG